jgi:hypothetical protein
VDSGCAGSAEGTIRGQAWGGGPRHAEIAGEATPGWVMKRWLSCAGAFEEANSIVCSSDGSPIHGVSA